jgi:hypothetical protein
VSEFSEQTVVYENETVEEARVSRAGYGAPAWEVEGWITTYTAIAAGELGVVTDHVARLTGHEPVSVREFLWIPRAARKSTARKKTTRRKASA